MTPFHKLAGGSLGVSAEDLVSTFNAKNNTRPTKYRLKSIAKKTPKLTKPMATVTTEPENKFALVTAVLSEAFNLLNSERSKSTTKSLVKHG